jgi:hypothetical protein
MTIPRRRRRRRKSASSFDVIQKYKNKIRTGNVR